MHKSRLAGFIIDCQTQDLDGAARFWSEALGMPPLKSEAIEDIHYRVLDAQSANLHVEVQQVEHPSRVHLDIESDDVEAEVARLEQLGAKRLRKIHTWWVMEAPTGQRFCVIQSRPGFEKNANTWPD